MKMPGEDDLAKFRAFLEQQQKLLVDPNALAHMSRTDLFKMIEADLTASLKAVELVSEFMGKLFQMEVRAIRAETALAERADSSVPPI